MNEPAHKVGGSYQADGAIVARFTTRDGKERVVFEFDEPRGMLHIFSPQQVALDTPSTAAEALGLREELAAAYAELLKHRPLMRGVFDRDVWERVAEYEENQR